MTNTPQCARPDVDPQDWFIRSDGKQYTDDGLLTAGERTGVARSVIPIAGETFEEHEARVKSAVSAAVNNRKRAALIRRRKAKDLCRECPIMVECLSAALDRREIHGTWGGLYEEELAEVRKEQARRERRRATINA